MTFESRKTTFEELKKELEDVNNRVIGLQGMGGTGKSTMAKEVSKHVKKSNAFDRIIFIEVSTPLDEKRILDDMVKELGLQIEEEKPLDKQIWNRIAHEGKVLIILDDVWEEELNLMHLGIRHGVHSKGRCCVLLTTRSMNVCIDMNCQKVVQLQLLPMEDALNLFLSHSTTSWNDFPPNLKSLAEEIVGECGGLPVMIELVAKAFKRWPPQKWHDTLIIFRKPNSRRHGTIDAQKEDIYKSLKFSYDNLKDKEDQLVFLLCSIFPKAYEIPLELLSIIVIGLGLFGEDNEYFTSRICVHDIINTLINSSALLNAGEGYVKMHDVIREVALETANEEIQVIMDSISYLKEKTRYLSWIINGFPNCYYCYYERNLEILLAWINAVGSLEVSTKIFEGMESLRVLLMHSKIEFGRTSTASLPKSIHSLKQLRTLSLKNWELGDISVVIGNLQKLESLELINCSIIELPNEISDLEQLRFLCIKHCSIEKNNPFEVIARCSQLEELYYVSNDDHIPIGGKFPQILSLPEYQIYHIIDSSNTSVFESSPLDTSTRRVFKPGKLQRIFSNDIITSMATRAEILELEGDNAMGCTNFIPSIVSNEDRVTEDIKKLYLESWPEMKCLVYTEYPQFNSGVPIFYKLVELQLVEVHARVLCHGCYPSGFLMQLEKLLLKHCQNLKSTLFHGNLELGKLKYISIDNCSMTCLFHPSTAQSLRLLETLEIQACSQLKYIIRDEGSSVEENVDGKDPNHRTHGSMFPKLKLLDVQGCDELEFIMPVRFCQDLPLLEDVKIGWCEKIKYMFGQHLWEEGLYQLQMETTLLSLKCMSIEYVPSDFSIYPECYLPQKLAAPTSDMSKEKDKSPLVMSLGVS